MSRPQQVARPIVRSLRQATASTTATCHSRPIAIRTFSSTPSRKDETTTTTSTPAEPSPGADAQKKASPYPSMIKQGSEEQLSQMLSPELGSRRRRAALATTGSVPFEQLPYQCFQEARKVLAQDRAEKVAKILAETAKIQRLEAADASTFRGGEAFKQKRLESLREHVERLKILADINDPMVKRRFEDGQGDMNKPIYRYLAHRKWCAMERKIILQRIEQFHIVPDLLPKFEPTMDVKMMFRGYKTPPGSILDSRITETAPTLRMQVFDKGERLFSVVVLDADVPDAESDSFKKRLHFLATNIPWGPAQDSLPLTRLGGGGGDGGESAASGPELGALAVPWLPAFAQKGAPYHRMTIFILQHADNAPLDAAKLQALYDGQGREGFSLKSFRDKFGLDPVGFTMFRTVWDENTADVMARHGIPGADLEFKQQRVMSLKPPRAARGWEARRQKPKFRHLWKYTKRIKGLKYKRGSL
ncbi:phosphatidylethanolamine-binding protein [Chaetomidium leptoderma]|uniref:Large ribosomal subunit protein mL38 n=1 Tax=Chaetomidium leptoderma TaxID=669021 RepID=A0AAN6VR92_9PEZI|nr:phosphatidylethanolamine-binding protein [Chaetomidium leptoderma]